MPGSRPAFLLSVCVVLVSTVGCGQVCDLDRVVGGLSVEVPWLSDDPFDVEMTAETRSLSFSCSALLEGTRRATTDNSTGDSDADLLARCGSTGFGVSTNDIPNSATFTLVHSGERHALVLDDIDAVDTTADDDCHEPAPVARITWSTP